MYIVWYNGAIIRRSEDLGLILNYCYERFGRIFFDNYLSGYVGRVGMSWSAEKYLIEILRD